LLLGKLLCTDLCFAEDYDVMDVAALDYDYDVPLIPFCYSLTLNSIVANRDRFDGILVVIPWASGKILHAHATQ
jgi:hypothetical protein